MPLVSEYSSVRNRLIKIELSLPVFCNDDQVDAVAQDVMRAIRLSVNTKATGKLRQGRNARVDIEVKDRYGDPIGGG